MFKTLLYGSLAIFGVLAALISPFYGAIAVLEAYLLHPVLYSPELASVRIQLVVALAFIAGLVLHGSRGLPRVGGEGRLLWTLCLYAGLVVASCLWAERRPEATWPVAIDTCKTVLVTVLLVRVAGNQQAVSALFWAMLIGGSHAAFMHTVGMNLGYLPQSVNLDGHGALPDFQGSVMVLLLPSFLLLALFGKDWKRRAFCFLTLPLVADSIVNTYQRAFFVAAAAQLLYLLAVAPWRAKLKLAACIVVGAATASALFMPDDYWGWIGTIRNYQQEGSAASRFRLGEASLRMLADHPLGVGARNYQYVSPDYLTANWLTVDESGELVRSAHSTYFTVACEFGVLGILLFAWTFAGGWWLLRKTRKIGRGGETDELAWIALGLEAGMVGWAVAGLFHSLNDVDPVFWTVALSIMLYRARRASLAPVHRRAASVNLWQSRQDSSPAGSLA